ncbi:EAL domain-containing protein [Marinomonas algarum]|uniref:EAL domain-containing protein n=1 Tax=Marinomonas algarum TaxID=2883105 RepID=A0A9X1LFX5_9GAMM|nr:EAL domain-containing protein [Marinomonas algarum]MCB5163226.1 EAL domain-containing protein [Marinomonas algarum]
MSLVIHWFSLTVPCLFIITNEATTILTQGGLKKIDFETVKINSNFVEEINVTDHDEKKFLNAIIAMIKNLNINLICEGIENKQQIDYLLQRGCTLGQGFYYSKAMPRNDILNYLSL